MDSTKLVNHFHHVGRNSNCAGLISHSTGNGLANPPGGIGGELITLGVVELLHSANQAEVTFLNQIQEGHTAPGVALSQGNYQAQVRFQEVVLCALTIAGDVAQIPFLSIGNSLAGILGLVQFELGVEASFDPFSEADFLFGS